MKISIQSRSPGFALIIAMIAIIVLSMLAAKLAISMKVEMTLARRADSEQQMLWLGRSGVELARYVLSEEMQISGEPYDSLNQIWAGGPGGPGETNSPLAGISLDNYQVGDGTVSIKIVDLERKANINRANTPELQQALTVMGVDADDISVVSDSILDWIDSDDSPRVAGAESDYYQSLTPPYYAKNAPIDDLSELLLVKGVTPEMYWGSNATNHPLSIFQQKQEQLGLGTSPGEAPDYPFGLADIFTPISSGKININTADTNVLQMIPGVDAATAAAIVQQRAGPDGVDGTDDDTPIQDPAGALKSAGDNNPQAANFVTTRSSTFEVHITARINGFEHKYVAILFRNSPTDIQVLSFYWK